uniref:Protein kinase domain-containing protein n=2 Tax=Chenopodium quinoa TaxID=63459 RepID=A0A803LUS8_CHEQI
MSTHNKVHKLLGCCLETKVPVLIYEWVAAETLEDRILLKDEKQNKLPVLEWKDRLRIAWEISCAVSYFHSAFPRPFIHGYLEPLSVFLNQDNAAILSNFSLSASIPEGQNFVVDHFVEETRGYEAPEYQTRREFTEYTDVYSFGVLFLVLLTGKDATFSCICIGENAKSTNIIDWVTSKIRNKRISEIVDPVINNSEIPASELSASIDLALRCTSFQAYKRPTMEDVEIELCNMLRSSKSIPTTSSVV